jgi:hypothetical protein
MRKIILAGAAMLATTGMAMAAGSDTVTISSTLPQSCSVDIPTATITLSPTTTASSQNFTYRCNFGSEESTATLTFDSTSDGVVGPGGEIDYNITFGSATGTSNSALVASAPVSTPNTNISASFSVALASAPLVAGTYTDVLNVSISP